MSCSADHRPAALRPGAEQPLYQPFGIGSAPAATGPGPVTENTLHVTPFYALRKFDLAGQPEAPRLLVPPLSGHLPVLLRDMALGLLASGLSVTVIDWANVRHVGIEHGSFGFDDNIGAIVEAILHIGRVFLSRAIACGTLDFRGRRISPGTLRRTRLITVEGAKDEIASPGQTRAAHALCSGLAESDRHVMVLPRCGHFGLFQGRLWREKICPALA